jgi:hypothetical protein
MSKSWVTGLTTIAAVLAAAGLAHAQVAPRPATARPPRGLFGYGMGDTGQQLVLNLSLGAGFDSDLLAGAGSGELGLPAAPGPRTGRFGSATATLGYQVERDRLTAGSNPRPPPGLRWVRAGRRAAVPTRRSPAPWASASGSRTGWT